MKRKYVVVLELRTLFTTEVEAPSEIDAELEVLAHRKNEDHPNLKFLTEEWSLIETQDMGAAE